VSKFLTPLRIGPLPAPPLRWWQRGPFRPRRRFVLLEPLVFRSDVLGRTDTVPAGFITDLASIPRLPVVYLLTGEAGCYASVPHDYYYQTGREPQGVADAVFYELLGDELDPEPEWRRWAMWGGVRAFGWTAYRGRARRAAKLNPVWTREGWPEPELAQRVDGI
jgi:hypothetical protein